MIILKTNLFIDKISLNRDRISSFEEYPFNIEIIKNFDELNLQNQLLSLWVKMVLANLLL